MKIIFVEIGTSAIAINYAAKIINAKYFWNGPKDIKTRKQFITFLKRKSLNPRLEEACNSSYECLI